MNLQQKWDSVYQQAEIDTERAAEVLLANQCLLPKTGLALDLACGLGANARYLARAGLVVQAWDISTVALSKLQQQAQSEGLSITTRHCDVQQITDTSAVYDVIIVTRFLDRSLSHGIMDALKPYGLLFYQTYTQAKLSSQGPKNPDYLLAENELLRLFAPLAVRFYQEYGHCGCLKQANRNEALFVGQKLN